MSSQPKDKSRSGHVVIGDREVGPGRPVYVIAELSANHNQSLDRALDLVRAAAAAGADAVKLQTYTPESMTLDSDMDHFLVPEGTLWAGRRLYHLYAEAMTPWEWHAPLQQEAEASGLDFLSAPFDATAVQFLDALGVVALKVASFELLDLELIKVCARTGRPLVLSTGMATQQEIDDAVSAATASGATQIVLLRCNSSYPAMPEEMDLRTIPDMVARWGRPVGLSDHTLDDNAALAAVALGASLIEKHLTLDRADGGPDSAFSLSPSEFARLVRSIRETEATLGAVRYGPSAREAHSLAFRRSLFVVKDVAEGERFTVENVRSIRPGHGLAPKHLDEVLGRRARQPIPRGTPMSWHLVAD